MPHGQTPKALVVSVHGMSRIAHEHAAHVGRIAARQGWATLSPIFDKDRYPTISGLAVKVGAGAQISPLTQSSMPHSIISALMRVHSSWQDILAGLNSRTGMPCYTHIVCARLGCLGLGRGIRLWTRKFRFLVV
jgi:hypothetical protein